MADPYARLAGVYDELVVDPCFASWADFVERTWSADADGVHRVLDVCCGTGLMTAELRSRGYDVSGLDASPAMLAEATVRLGSEVPLVEVTLPDLTDARELAGPFDAMVSTFDGLNYLDRSALELTLRHLAERLRPGGWLVFDVHAEAILALVRDNPVVLGDRDDVRWAVTYVVDEDARTCRSIMRVEAADSPSASFVEEHLQYLHSADAVSAALSDAGFELVSVTDEYSDAPLAPDSLRATWVARRRAPRHQAVPA